MNLLKYLLSVKPQKKLPRLRKKVYEPQGNKEIERRLEYVLRSGVVRNTEDAELVLSEYEVDNAADLIRKLPRARPDVGRRWRELVAFWEGGYASDPNYADWREFAKRHRNK